MKPNVTVKWSSYRSVCKLAYSKFKYCGLCMYVSM